MLKYKQSTQARKDLRAINKYYVEKAGEEISFKIISSILKSIKLLTTQPNLGYIEPDLEEFPQCFRCLVNVPNYKIIYWVEDDTIKIATVFDCRQRPQLLHYLINNRTDWVCEPPVEYITNNQKTQK